MIRRNSLRTRMASQFGSRIASSFDKDFNEIASYLSGLYDEKLFDFIDVSALVEGDIIDAPDFEQFALSYEQKFGHPLDAAEFLYDIEVQHRRAIKMILQKSFAKLKAGKV